MNSEKLITLELAYLGTKTKTVRVFVPEHDDGELLPVIYMTDGQNLFEDNRPRQFGCWYTREAVKEERESSGKAAIIVGIHNDESPVQRAKELTPKSMGAIKFPDDMPEHIRKMMAPEGENTAFCGSSSGGLQAYFTALSHPDKFCMAGVFSPTFPMLYTKNVIRWTKETVGEIKPFIYIYSGANDRMEQEICESTKAVVEAISEFYPKEKLKVNILPNQPHHESAWAMIFKDLLHLFLTRREAF